jgi:hypothetical protein
MLDSGFLDFLILGNARYLICAPVIDGDVVYGLRIEFTQETSPPNDTAPFIELETPVYLHLPESRI